MFEAECPSCQATYQVDERRVPPQGLKMRCPKCGESFQVTAPGQSDPPVLGAALGLSAAQDEPPPKPKPKPRHKPTMLGVADQAGGPKAPPRPAGRPPGERKTMMGVAPAAGAPLELADLDDDDALGNDDDLALDLQSSRRSDADLPSPRQPSSPLAQIDLPSIPPSKSPRETTPPDSDELDLRADHGELPDLPAAPGRQREFQGESELELPSLGSEGAQPPFEQSGLPSPAGANLPSRHEPGLPRRSEASLPDLTGDLPDLDPGLPTVGGLPGAPPPRRAAAAASDSLADELDPSDLQSEAPPAWGAASELDDELGASADDIFGHGPTTAPQSVPAAGSDEVSKFGEVDFAAPNDFSSSGADDLGEFDAFPTEEAAGGSSATEGGYGDVALEGGGGDFDLETDVDRPAPPDPDAVPRGPAAAASAAVELPRPREKAEKASRKKKSRKTTGLSKGTRIALAVVLLLAIAGGALAAFVPHVGPYGVYWILDTVRADEYRAHLQRDIETIRERLKQDTSKDVELSFREVQRGLASAPRFQPRAAYAAHLGYLHQLRFGGDSDAFAKASVLLKDLSEADPSVLYLDLARLTEEAVSPKPSVAVARAPQLLSRGVEYAVVIGEAALKANKPDVASQAWAKVLQVEPESARAHFGAARALVLSGAPEAQVMEHIEATLQTNPEHAGARLVQAEFFVKSREKDEKVLANLTPIIENPATSRAEQVSAYTVLGRLHLQRARLKKAEDAFTRALALDGTSASAQKGLGQAFFQSGRYGEALTRFEGALRSEPDDLTASLGVVRTKLRLEQLQDAVKLLDSLKGSHPKSGAVAYWVGRGKEAVGEKDVAEKAYEQAIETGDDVPELVLAHISLTRLLSQKGHFDEANQVIQQAKKRFPDDPAVYQALGELAASSGGYDEAVRHYEEAIELDPQNLGLRFARGVALRQARRFEEASAAFDFVEKESPEYPGLAVERGNLFEASGDSDRALQAYEDALATAPEDVDLQLRVACGRASAGQAEEAIKLLRPILEQRQGSAEVNFCMGLAQLNAQELPEARRYLQRAVSRDPTRAKHHLYVGWVALAMNDLPLARLSFDKALELDRTLADAYWKRGELRVRQKAVRDALVDLDKALELSPSRLEAHAQKALAYIELGKEQDAMASFQKAVESPGADPYWHYKYGELLLANRRPQEAQVQLQAAVDGVSEDDSPVWWANVHRLLAMALGPQKAAIKHYQVYIDSKKGDPQDPYLREALDAVNRIMRAQGFN